MNSQNGLHEGVSESIDIVKLAHELGVEEKYFKYGDRPAKALQLIDVCVGDLFLEDMGGKQGCMISKDLANQWYRYFDTFPEIDTLLLYIPKNTIDKWRLDIFIIHLTRYLTLRGLRNKLSRMEDIFSRNMLVDMTPIAVQMLNDTELKSALGIKFFDRMAPIIMQDMEFMGLSMQLAQYEYGEHGYHELVKKLNASKMEVIDAANVRFWSSTDLPLVKLFIDNKPTQENPSLDIPYLDRLLCHANAHLFPELLEGFTHNESKHIPAWKVWIEKKGTLLFDETETNRVFCKVFGISGQPIIQHKNRGRLVVNKKIPEDLHPALLKVYKNHPRASQKATVAKVVATVLSSYSGPTSIDAIVSRPLVPTKEIFTPNLNRIFTGWEVAKKEKIQLLTIDLSSFPTGSSIIFERSIPDKKVKKSVFHSIEIIDQKGINTIPPVFGKEIDGHFHYRITVTLPSTHRFAGKNVFEVSYYAKAEPTPVEIEEEKKRQQETPKNQSETLPTPVIPIVTEVVKKVEKIIDPAEMSLIAAAFVLEENFQKYSNNDMYKGGPIEIVISHADASEVLGDDSESLLPTHRTWTIQEDGTIHPHTDNTDICDYLFTIKETLHTKVQEGRERQQKEENQLRDQAEYEQERLKFAPILDFARGFQFEGKQNGHFEDQKEKLRTELRALGWSLPVSFAGSQVIWRHIESKVRILYASKQCVSFAVNGEQSELTGSQKKCYEEVAQAFSHIVRFFNVEAKERTRMVNKEKAIRKETETGAVACDKHLQDGRARLVLFGAYRGGHGIWSSKFPTEKTPYMLDVRASYQNIEAILEQYPHAELCYCRDKLCINGEIDKDAGEGSVENTLQNIHDLRNSPRARYILKKRILITYKLEKFSGETDRAPIKHEKNKKEGTVSALDILLDIKEKKNIQSAADITEDFLNYYIDELERNRIRVHYVWPLSARLDEHQARIKKYTAKGVASEVGITAD